LDTTIEKQRLFERRGDGAPARAADGLTVVPMDLFPTLRVSQVDGEHGETLDFVQEKKEDDPDFGLVLAAPLKKGETATVKITYGGKDAVRNAETTTTIRWRARTGFPTAARRLEAIRVTG
jgi:hypothetical protein